MKKILWLLVLPVLLLQCNEDDVIPGFEMDYFRDFQIFAGLNTIETHVFTFNNINARYQDFLTLNGATTTDIQRIIPKYFRLTNLNGNITFGDLWRVRLFITNTDGTLEREIAFLEPVPSNAGFVLDLAPTLAEVNEILENGAFNLQLKLNYRDIPAQSIDARLSVVFQAVTL